VLPEGWTEQTLLVPHTSQPHNPDVANTFFRAGEIEAWGRGIERIFEACRDAGALPPRVRFDTGGIWVEFDFDEAYLQVIRGEVTREVTREVTPEVRLVLALAAGALSRRALQDALSLKDDEHFRLAYLLPALADGLLEMTIPDKPRSRLQKYRLTEAGKVRLAQLKSEGSLS
jgi:ATP-dependent DNA helicase RecG